MKSVSVFLFLIINLLAASPVFAASYYCPGDGRYYGKPCEYCPGDGKYHGGACSYSPGDGQYHGSDD